MEKHTLIMQKFGAIFLCIKLENNVSKLYMITKLL